MLTVSVIASGVDPATGNTVAWVDVLDFEPSLLAKALQRGAHVRVDFDGLATEADIAAAVTQQYPDATYYASIPDRTTQLLNPALVAAGLRDVAPDGEIVMSPLAEQIDTITDDFLATLPPREA